MGFFIYIMSKLTKELVEAGLIPALTDRRWPELLEAIKTVKVSRDTIHSDYDTGTKMRAVLDWLDEEFDRQNADDKERIETRKAAFDAYRQPIKEFLLGMEPELIRINEEILLEERKVQDEIDKENEIKTRYAEFVNETTRKIISTTDNSELVLIQKMIGSEKSKKSFYGEKYFPMVDRVSGLLIELINGQKQMIKDNDKLSKDEQKAIEANDQPLLVSLRNQREYNEAAIKENAREISLKAFGFVSEISTVTEKLVSGAIAPRLNRWAYRVDDINLLSQKMPHLVKLEENKGAIGKFVKSKTESGELTENKEHTFHGLTIYRKKFYVSPSK